MTYVTTHDDIRSAGRSQLQISVIFRIEAVLDDLDWFNALRSKKHDVEDVLASFDRDETIELRSQYSVPDGRAHAAAILPSVVISNPPRDVLFLGADGVGVDRCGGELGEAEAFLHQVERDPR